MADYGVKGLIPWLYYRDLSRAMAFYEMITGLSSLARWYPYLSSTSPI